MQSKLTIRLDSALIRRAKDYARRSGKSIASVVAEYFASLSNGVDRESDELPPKVRSLKGALRGSKVSENDYRAHIEEKHR